MTGIFTVNRHVDDRADAVAVLIADSELPHQLAVARRHGVSVDLCHDPVAADLLDIAHAAAVDFPAVGLLQALADRVGGRALGQRRVFQKLHLFHLVVVYAGHLEHTLRQGARLVKDNVLGFREDLQIVRALDEDALLARAADAGEEAQRNADDERAGAADHEEGQGAVDPAGPVRGQAQREPHDGQRDGEHHRGDAHGGRVDSGKAGDKRLRPGLAGAGVFHEIEDLGDRRLPELLRRPHLQHAVHVDAAADDLVALLHVARKALAGQRAGVQAGAAADDDAVQRNLFARLHNNDAADGDLIRVDLLQLSVLLDIGVIGPDIHQRADVPAALADGVALEQLADLIEQHHGDALHIIAALRPDREEKRAQRRDGHQEVFVKGPAVEDALSGFLQNVVPDHQIGNQIGRQLRDAGKRDELQSDQHDRSNDDAHEHLLLLFRHVTCSSSFSFNPLVQRSSQWAARGVTARSRSRARPSCRPSARPS